MKVRFMDCAANVIRVVALLVVCFVTLPARSIAGAIEPAAGESESDDASDEPQRSRVTSLDDELLEGLDGDPIDGIDEAKCDSPAAKQTSSGGIDDELLRGLGDGEDVQLEGGQDPLSTISGRMHEVERLIADADTGEGTQDKQRLISAEMEKLIRQLQKQCQACKQASSKRQRNTGSSRAGQNDQAQRASDQAARDSSNRLDEKKAEKPDVAAMREMVKAAWGHLPDHLRQQMEQSPSVEFLPQYLVLIEDYFKVLAKGERRKGSGDEERR
ncbi:MAG TPA: hypothetical protein VGX78_04135, partial [Pirellulales bacterium]|nr:hypothetical protein [Pirellulales bacterium]